MYPFENMLVVQIVKPGNLEMLVQFEKLTLKRSSKQKENSVATNFFLLRNFHPMLPQRGTRVTQQLHPAPLLPPHAAFWDMCVPEDDGTIQKAP